MPQASLCLYSCTPERPLRGDKVPVGVWAEVVRMLAHMGILLLR
jgi:hypothetical protein